ncbi:Ig-like domain-containing protein [Bacillus sp. JJ722]|uniref:Ig-like domain-containing protein n=1 Tax=Bacillus sp. JJ722 TaxID=3122973 RepID=UPI002FFDF0E0
MKRKRSRVVTSLVLSSVIASSTFMSGFGVVNVNPIVASAADTVEFKLLKDIGAITNQGNNQVVGQLSKKGTVDAVINIAENGTITENKSVISGGGPVSTDDNGNFSFTIEQLPVNTKIVFKFNDTETNKQFTKVVTVQDINSPELDVDPPEIRQVDIKNTSKVIKGTVSEPGTVTATQGSKVIGTTTVKASDKDASGNYPFTITMNDFQKEGAVITLQAKDTAKPTPLESVIVNAKVEVEKANLDWAKAPSITDAMTIVEGQINRAAKVQFFNEKDKALNATPVTTDAYGKFKVSISKQPAGTKVRVKITDFAGNIVNKTIEVKDQTAPVFKKVNTVYDTSKLIEGQLSEAATITVELPSGQKLTPIDTETDGTFKIQITQQTKNAKINLIAVDSKNNESKPYTITIKEDRVAPKLIDPKKIVIDDSKAKTKVTGQINEPGKVTVKDTSGNDIVTKKPTDDSGKFTVYIPKQVPNARLTFIFEDLKDPKPNQSKSTVTVTDVTKPVIVDPGILSTSSKVLSGTVSEPSIVTATSGGKVIGKVTVSEKNKVADGKYSFVITLRAFPTEGTKIQLQAKDYAKPRGLESAIKVVTASKDTNPPQLVGSYKISDTQTSLQGQVDKSANVQLFVGSTPLNTKAVQTDKNGKFRISFKKQPAGTIIIVVTSNPTDSTIKSKKYIGVSDATSPTIKKVNYVYDTSDYVTGQISEAAKVTVTTTTGQTLTVDTDSQGNFEIKLPSKLAKGDKITVTAVDKNKNASKRGTTVTVKEDNVGPVLIEPKAIVIDDSKVTKVSGKVNEAGTLDVTVDGVSIINNKVDIGADGTFTVDVPRQPANTKLTFVFEDLKSNQSKKLVVVKDATPPVIKYAQISMDGSKKVIIGTVSEASYITAMVNNKSIGRVSAKKVAGSTDYEFKISLSKNYQTAGTVINLSAKDYARPKAFESSIKTITVQ